MQYDTKYPGGSKAKVDRAGNNFRNNRYNDEDFSVIENWRAAHKDVLNTFQALLRTKAKNKNIFIAQRHKRMSTICDKLKRLPTMQLSRMDDVAGCRLIFNSIGDLYDFRKYFNESPRFHHKRKNELDKYDYIKTPKNSGYRGVHDIYIYDVNSSAGKRLKGLYVEIQYRTLIQHAWATAVEIIGSITESQPKFQKGDDRYVKVMAYASEILARSHEEKTGPFPELSNEEVINRFFKLEGELSLFKTLTGLRLSRKEISSKKNIILMFSSDGNLEIQSYKYAPSAIEELFRLEKEYPDKDIVLIRADRSEDARVAFRNYFSDTEDFMELMKKAIELFS